MIDRRPQGRCDTCGRAFAIAPDREEPAGTWPAGVDCWSCAFNATDLAIMKSEAADMLVQLRLAALEERCWEERQ